MKPTVIDLFCGCGGLSLGFSNAGFNMLLGIDNDGIALNTFRKNRIAEKVLDLDANDPNFLNTIRKSTDNSPIDIVMGGPPCQGFSLTGPRDLHDKRNNLFVSLLKVISEFTPKVILLENVPGLVTLYKGKMKDEIIRSFGVFGYNVSWKVLTATDYGVPQLRKRVFIVGLLKKIGIFDFPKPTNTPANYISCEDAISDLPSREHELGNEIDQYDKSPLTEYQYILRNECKVLYNHTATNHTDMVKEVISLVPEGGNYKDLPPGVGESRKFNEAWTRYHSKKPSRTIDTGHRNHFHYKWNRVPTVRENARLQSFPDSFVFHGNRTQQYRQVGNAVPPILAKHLAEKIKTYLVDMENTNSKSYESISIKHENDDKQLCFNI